MLFSKMLRSMMLATMLVTMMLSPMGLASLNISRVQTSSNGKLHKSRIDLHLRLSGGGERDVAYEIVRVAYAAGTRLEIPRQLRNTPSCIGQAIEAFPGMIRLRSRQIITCGTIPLN